VAPLVASQDDCSKQVYSVAVQTVGHVLQDVIKHDLAYLGNLLGHLLADSSMLLAPSWATAQLLQLPDSNLQGAPLYPSAPQAMCSLIHLRIPQIVARIPL